MLGNVERASGEIQKTYRKYDVSTHIVHEIAIVACIEVARLACRTRTHLCMSVL